MYSQRLEFYFYSILNCRKDVINVVFREDEIDVLS
jgi:hypothetical protein